MLYFNRDIFYDSSEHESCLPKRGSKPCPHRASGDHVHHVYNLDVFLDLGSASLGSLIRKLDALVAGCPLAGT